MAGRRMLFVAAATSAGLILPGVSMAIPASASPTAPSRHCSAGAHTLSPPGSVLYPETGNGGYTSVHTLVHLVYNATANRFLTGTHVVLTDRATQCLSSFSLDFEPRRRTPRAAPTWRCSRSR